MPLPMTVPTTMAAAWLVVKRRASSRRPACTWATAPDIAICGLGAKCTNNVAPRERSGIVNVDVTKGSALVLDVLSPIRKLHRFWGNFRLGGDSTATQNYRSFLPSGTR